MCELTVGGGDLEGSYRRIPFTKNLSLALSTENTLSATPGKFGHRW